MVEPVIPGTEKILPGVACCASPDASGCCEKYVFITPDICLVTIFVIADKCIVVR